MPIPWLPDELETLRRLRAEGASLKEIAQATGRPVGGVKNQFNKINKAERSPQEKSEVVQAVDAFIPSDGRLDDDVRAMYQKMHTQAVTIEMVLYTLWKTPKQLRALSIEDAAIKLVQLVGQGPEYFWDKRGWKIQTWIDHLTKLGEKA